MGEDYKEKYERLKDDYAQLIMVLLGIGTGILFVAPVLALMMNTSSLDPDVMMNFMGRIVAVMLASMLVLWRVNISIQHHTDAMEASNKKHYDAMQANEKIHRATIKENNKLHNKAMKAHEKREKQKFINKNRDKLFAVIGVLTKMEVFYADNDPDQVTISNFKKYRLNNAEINSLLGLDATIGASALNAVDAFKKLYSGKNPTENEFADLMDIDIRAIEPLVAIVMENKY